MAPLGKKWALELKSSAIKGDISGVLSDVVNKLRPGESAAHRHVLAEEILAKVSLLLSDKTIQLAQAVLNTSCQIVTQCCKATDPFQDETQMYSFLCSLFYSIEVFLSKGMIKEALELRKHIIGIKGKDTQLPEKIAKIIMQIGWLYIKEILDPLRGTYDRNCDDKSYFSLMNVLDDTTELLMCGGIHNFQTAVNYSTYASKLKPEHVTEKSCALLIAHQMKVIQLGEVFRHGSCELVQNGPELCREYLFATFLVVYRALAKDLDDSARMEEALSKLDLVIKFAESNRNLCNCIKFYKHFSEALIGLIYDKSEPREIEKNFELSFCALSSIIESNIDELMFKVLFKSCDYTSLLIQRAYNKLNGKSCEWWNRRIDIDLLVAMNKVILKMDTLIDANGHSDCKGSDRSVCPAQSSSKLDVSLMIIVSRLVSVSLKHKLKGIHLLVQQAVSVQSACLKHVESLKALGCVQWKKHWIDVAIVSYNLSIYCKKSDLESQQNTFLKDLLDSFLCLEDLACPSLTSFTVWNCLTELFHTYKLLLKFRAALVTLVIAMAAVPGKKAKIFQLWLTIRNDKLAAKLSDKSLWKIFSKEKADLQSKYPLDFDKLVVRDEIVVLELEALCSSSLEEYPTGMEESLAAVKKLTLDAVWAARAVLALLKRTWTIDEAPSKELLALAKARLGKVPARLGKDSRDLGFISVELAFWVFLCQLKSDRNRMKAEMERGTNQRIPTQLEDLRRTPADVVPAYCNLDVRNEMLLLDSLAAAVTISCGLVDGADVAAFGEGSADSWDRLRNHVEIAARIYESFGYDQLAIDCWGLLSKLASLTGDQLTSLLAFGHLLAELDHEPARDLLRQADALAETLAAENEALGEDSKSETREVVVAYHLRKSAGCLNNGRFAEGKSALKQALAMLSTWPDSNTVWHAEARLITSQLQLLPAGVLDVNDLGDDSPHTTVLLALATIKNVATCSIKYVHESRIFIARLPYSLGHNCQITKVFCAVTFLYARVCVRQGFAREFEMSTPKLLVALQRQALALRTAQFLGALANMDLICEKPDCQVKINGMENITLLGKSVGCLRVARKARKEVPMTPLHQLLIRNAASNRIDLPESPIFQPIPFTAPEFMSHKSDCRCMYCANPEIQTVAFEIICLQAWFYSLHGNNNQALEFFKGAELVHKNLMKKQTAIFDCLAKVLPKYLKGALHLPIQNGSWKSTLFRIKFHTDLSYIDFHARHNMVEKALEMNLSLAATLKKFPLVNSFLRPELLHQQLCCVSRTENKTSVAFGSLCVPYLAMGVRKSISQVVAETPLGPTKISFTKTTKRPFSIFTDRYLGIHPKVLDLKTPLPKPALASSKPVVSSTAIMHKFLKNCNEEEDEEDFIEPSPEVLPSTRRKIRPGTGLTARRLDTITKAKDGLKVQAESSAQPVSPIMPEPKKKLLFNVDDESTNSAQLKRQNKITAQAMEREAPEKTQKPVKTTSSRARLRPQAADDLEAATDVAVLKSKKVDSLPERRTKRQTEAQTQSKENSQHNEENDKAVKPGRTKVPIKAYKSGKSTDSSQAGSETATCRKEDGITQVANLLQNIKIEENQTNATQKPTKYRLKPAATATSSQQPLPTATKSRKVLQPMDIKKEPDGETINLDHQAPRTKVGRPNKVQMTTAPKLRESRDPSGNSGPRAKGTSKSSECVGQNIHVEPDDENSKPAVRQKRAAKPALIKPKIKAAGSSTSSSDGSKEKNLANEVRSPLKAGLENSPVKPQRGRRALL